MELVLYMVLVLDVLLIECDIFWILCMIRNSSLTPVLFPLIGLLFFGIVRCWFPVVDFPGSAMLSTS